MISLTDYQIESIELPADNKIFLEGPAGSGKTTAAVERLLHLMMKGIPGDSILVLVPQRTLGAPYYDALQHPGVVAGGTVTLVTLGGLARRMVELFWPVVAEQAGFDKKIGDPTFLNMESAQYFMAHLVNPLLKEGYFDSISLEPNRIYSQVLDNLNKSAFVGFPHTQIGEKLKAAWSGEPGQKNVYDDAQTCANLFREYCLENNLLDFSLQVEVFRNCLMQIYVFDEYFFRIYRHVIVDNIEEDTPVFHNILGEWMDHFQSAMIVYDTDGGFRRFLGADPESGYKLKSYCDQKYKFQSSMVCSDQILSLRSCFSNAFYQLRSQEKKTDGSQTEIAGRDIRAAFEIKTHRFYPSMIDWSVETAVSLIEDEGTVPGEIVILAPYLSDSTRFMLTERFALHGIPVTSHRPSRSLRDEPAVRCLLSLASLAYPEWELPPTRTDVSNALMFSIHGMDLIRADLLTKIVYQENKKPVTLTEFSKINPEMQERISYRLGSKYEQLREWLDLNQNSDEDFDHFLKRFFGEVLSQPGFRFYDDFDAGRVTANLVESIRKFRWSAEESLRNENKNTGKEYLTMVQDGVIAAQYLQSWHEVSSDAVFLAPAYTFLMANRPVDYQIWLDIGNRGWYERISQPLTQPYVLSRNWSPGQLWTDRDEVRTGIETLERISLGLLQRCRCKVFMGTSQLGERGYEQRGPFFQVVQRVLRNPAFDE